MGLTVLFIIVNAIRLAVVARADEIEIMRLVGASDAFIRWPFVFEGALVGLFGALITLGLLWLVQGRARRRSGRLLRSAARPGQRHGRPERGPDRAPAPVSAVGVLGSYLSVRSYLSADPQVAGTGRSIDEVLAMPLPKKPRTPRGHAGRRAGRRP